MWSPVLHLFMTWQYLQWECTQHFLTQYCKILEHDSQVNPANCVRTKQYLPLGFLLITHHMHISNVFSSLHNSPERLVFLFQNYDSSIPQDRVSGLMQVQKTAIHILLWTEVIVRASQLLLGCIWKQSLSLCKLSLAACSKHQWGGSIPVWTVCKARDA